MNVVKLSIAVLGALSVVSWGYRLSEEHWRVLELPIYALLCLVPLGLISGAIWMISSSERWIRVVGIILSVPFLALWLLSVTIGFFGLKIH